MLSYSYSFIRERESRALHKRTRTEATAVHARLLARVRAANGNNPMHVCKVQECARARAS